MKLGPGVFVSIRKVNTFLLDQMSQLLKFCFRLLFLLVVMVKCGLV